MALQVWLPLTGTLENKGISNVTVTNNGATVNASGKIGSCYYFDGTNDRISCSSITYSYPLSLCAWIKGETITASETEYILSYNTATGGTAGHNIGIGTYGGKLSIWHGGTVTSYATALTNNTWYHVAAVVTSSSYKLYLNGVEVISGTGTQSNVGSVWLTFGARSASSTGGIGAASYYFKGFMNDIRVYDHCLSAAEVKKISKGLILHYMLNDPELEDTTNVLGGKTCSGHGSSWTLQTETFNGSKIYRNTVTNPGANTNNNAGFYYNTLFNLSLTNNYIVLSFYVKLITPYNIQLAGYLTCNKTSGGTTSVYWSGHWNIPDWSTNSAYVGKWKYVTAICQFPSSVTASDIASWKYFYVYGDKATQGSADFACIQVEFGKDHATPYTNGTRQKRIAYDASGYNYNASVLNGPLSIAVSPRYKLAMKFTATNKKIKIAGLSTSQITNSYTISWWSKQNTFSGTMAWGFGDGIRLNGIYGGNLWNTGDSSNNPLYQPGTTTQVSAPSVNVWHHFAMIGDGSTCKVYKDGTLWAQAKTYKGLSGTTIYINGWDTSNTYSMSDLTMSDFRIYATALSASDVLELYNTSMIVNSDGTISPRVLTS